MKYAMWVLVLAVSACVTAHGSIDDPRTYGLEDGTCTLDVDAHYAIRTAESPSNPDPTTLWDWRNADCSREQITTQCVDGRLDVFCRATVQSWTLNPDGSVTFHEVDSSGLESTERVSVSVAW